MGKTCEWHSSVTASMSYGDSLHECLRIPEWGTPTTSKRLPRDCSNWSVRSTWKALLPSRSASYTAQREISTWYKIRNPRYSQMVGREKLFEREWHDEPVAGWHRAP